MALDLTIFLDDGGVMNDNALRAVTVFSAGEVSLRQAVTPLHLQGREPGHAHRQPVDDAPKVR